MYLPDLARLNIIALNDSLEKGLGGIRPLKNDLKWVLNLDRFLEEDLDFSTKFMWW